MIVDGIHVAQTQSQLDLFDELIDKFDIRAVIELGMYRGGLANLLIKKQSDNFRYYGFQLDADELDGSIRYRPETTIADVNKPEIIEQIRGIVNSINGAVLIFCDTFDKPREMNTYSNILRIGDFVQGHDYPGEVTDRFLEWFRIRHPDLEEIEPNRIRKELGTTVWRKIK